jgi:hypothetical protein
MLVDNIEIIYDGRYRYPENGISYDLIFTGIDYNIT